MREKPWLAAVVFLAYLIYVVCAYRQGFADAQAGKRPLLTDFTTTYGAALLVWRAPLETLYFPPALAAANQAAAQAAYFGRLSPEQIGPVVGPWMYPPPAAFFLPPLALLPYHIALAAMLAFSAIPYLLAASRWLPERAKGLWLVLAAPPTFYNLMFGQTSFWPIGLIALGLYWLPSRPWLAGLVIGLASIKPHLGLLLPFALLAGGHWRTFTAACATVGALILASLFAFGLEPWYAFLGRSLAALDGFARGAYAWSTMVTPLAFAKALGAPLAWAEKFQGTITAIAILLTLAIWRVGRQAPERHAARSAWLLAASVAVVPMAFLYDLVALTLAAVCLLADGQGRHRSAHRWTKALILVSFVFTLLAKPAGAFGPVLAGCATGIFMALAAWRALSATPLAASSDTPATSPKDSPRAPDSFR